MRINIIISIPFLILFLCSCHRATSEHTTEYHDAETIILGFDHLGDTCRQNVFAQYCLNDKTYKQILDIYGAPAFEFTDTLIYGTLIKDTMGYYYPFDKCPDEINTIPELILFGKKWQLNETDVLTVYFINHSKNDLCPIYGAIQVYTEGAKPFWLLDERNWSLRKVLEKHGEPRKQSIITVENEFSDLVSFGEDICKLDSLPLDVTSYMWIIDSLRLLFLYYPVNTDVDRTLPIWGFQCTEDALMLE